MFIACLFVFHDVSSCKARGAAGRQAAIQNEYRACTRQREITGLQHAQLLFGSRCFSSTWTHSFPANENINQSENGKKIKNKCGYKEILTTKVEGAELKTLKVRGGRWWRLQQVCIDPLCALPQQSSKSSRRCRDRKEGWRTVKRWKGPAWPWGH